MKRYVLFVAVMLFAVAGMAGCGGTKAVKAPGGEKYNIFILSHRGDPEDMGERQFQYRNEVGEYMERDIINTFNRAGYNASLIKDRSDYKQGPDNYLLIITINSYNPGSQVARMLVGYGAGTASLDNHYELYGTSDQALLSYDDGIGSSRGWQQVIIKLNQNTLTKVTQKLGEK